MKYTTLFFGSIFLFFSCQTEDALQQETRLFGQIGQKAGIATAHPVATAVGMDVLREGGNAYDAAVAVQFALAVVYPRAGNIGGGGLAVLRQQDGAIYSLDFREKAPGQAYKNMYLDEEEEPIDKLSTVGPLAAGVPGTVAGMAALHERFGSLPWDKLVAPAMLIAEKGVSLTKAEAEKLNENQSLIKENSPGTPAFLNENEWQEGDTLKQPELAETLRRISEQGKKGFYEGETAALIARQMEATGGLITEEDLASYEAAWREPIKESWEDYNIISMPPPSSGGIAVVQLLKGTSNYPVEDWGHNSLQTLHIMTELERRVYADRAVYIGDPDFVDVPTAMLMSDTHLEARFGDIKEDEKTDSQEIKEGNVEVIESIETTHFSILDEMGNAISLTTTLNGNFGCKVVVDGAGFLLNNEMDDFSIKAGVPNMFGLVGSEANAIVPHKRMLSSMTPTILEKNGDLYMLVGTPGGATIITSVYQTILNVVKHNMSMQEAINAKKLHHQWLPDHVLVEEGALTDEVALGLSEMGHQLKPVSAIGRVDAILIHAPDSIEAAADYTRGDDSALAY